MDLGLRGHAILVSGATRGIGRAIAGVLVAEGADLLICSRSQADVDETVAELHGTSGGGRAAGVALDVTADGSGARLVDAAVGAFGRLDGVVSNAGGAVGQPRFADTTADDWAESYRWNVIQTTELLRAALPALAGTGGSAVVVGSISAALPSPWPQYAAAKAALESVTRSLAAEFASDRVRVNCVRPGSVLFEGGAWERYAQAEPAAFRAFVEADLPWGRLARPEHIANVVAFLLSPRAEWVTGSVIPVDGGQQRSSPFPTTDSHDADGAHNSEAP